MSGCLSLHIPEQADMLADLEPDTKVLLTGTIYTMRDAGHERALAYLHEHGELPFGLAGQVLFYAGPTPPRAGRPFGAIGPTTASRMDFAAPELYAAGIKATIGKGNRSNEVRAACKDHHGSYLTAVGGIAALLADCVDGAELVAWEDLGTEALYQLHVTDFPAYVAFSAV